MKRGDVWTAAAGGGYAGKHIGRLAAEDMVKLGRAFVIFMGLA